METTSSSLADALLAIAEAFLAGKVAAADNPDVYQVIVHVGTDGAAIPASPALPPTDGTIEGCHDADITPDTIIPSWYGERLNLDHAIYVCLANAENQARQRRTVEQRAPQDQREQQEQQDQQDTQEQHEPFRPRAWVVNPFDWFARLSREHPAA